VVALNPSEALLIADVVDEVLGPFPGLGGPPSPLHVRLMDIRDRLRDSETDAPVSIPGVRVIEADGMPMVPALPFLSTTEREAMERAYRSYLDNRALAEMRTQYGLCGVIWLAARDFYFPENVREVVAKAICDDDALRNHDEVEAWDNPVLDASIRAEYRSNADAVIRAFLKGGVSERAEQRERVLEALAELVRLRDLEETDEIAYLREVGNGAREAAWDQARCLL
jgi:hypothetical protein